jgi:hypothetical protein
MFQAGGARWMRGLEEFTPYASKWEALSLLLAKTTILICAFISSFTIQMSLTLTESA